jgi:hypothetical protein
MSTWSSIVEVAVDFPVITGDHLRQPEIDDPQHLLQLIMDNKIEVVAKILQMELLHYQIRGMQKWRYSQCP